MASSTFPLAKQPRPQFLRPSKSRLNDGLVLWLPSQRGGGNTWYDISRNGNNGTLTNFTGNPWSGSVRPGGLGNSLAFDGVNDSVSVPVAVMTPVTTAFAFSCWLNLSTTSGSQTIVRTDGGTGSGGFFFRISGGVWEAWVSGISRFASPLPAVGEWTHIVLVYKDAKLSLYQNSAVLMDNLAVNPLVASTAFWLGTYGGGEYFSGSLGSVRLYSRALSAAEVLDLYLDDLRGNPKTLSRQTKTYFLLTETVSQVLPTQPYNAVSVKVKSRKPLQVFTSRDRLNDGLLTHLEADLRKQSKTWYDTSGKGNNATIQKNTWVADDYAALSFNGSNYASLTLPTLTDVQTKSFWVKQTSSGNCTLINESGIALSNFVQINAHKIRAGMQTGVYVTSKTTLQENVWYHVCVVTDDSWIYLYINGVLESSDGGSSGFGTDSIAIGYYNPSPSQFFTGLMRSVRFYERMLSDGEVFALYLKELSKNNAFTETYLIGNVSPSRVFYGSFASTIRVLQAVRANLVLNGQIPANVNINLGGVAQKILEGVIQSGISLDSLSKGNTILGGRTGPTLNVTLGSTGRLIAGGNAGSLLEIISGVGGRKLIFSTAGPNIVISTQADGTLNQAGVVTISELINITLAGSGRIVATGRSGVTANVILGSTGKAIYSGRSAQNLVVNNLITGSLIQHGYSQTNLNVNIIPDARAILSGQAGPVASISLRVGGRTIIISSSALSILLDANFQAVARKIGQVEMTAYVTSDVTGDLEVGLTEAKVILDFDVFLNLLMTYSANI